MNADDRIALPAFHAGEALLQERAGLAERMAEVGSRAVRRFMPDQHREFFTQLPYLIVGALDGEGQPWATLLTGTPGFVQSPHDAGLEIAALPTENDPLAGRLQNGAPVGLLGFQAHTRRRNRANGSVAAANAEGFVVKVRESFGNCPKYIQARQATLVEIGPEQTPIAGTQLDLAMRNLVANADTFFIASAHPDAGDSDAASYGMDVSHRGGKTGFVKIDQLHDGHDRLLVPDFVGNFFFNTLGNIALNPRIGLLFIDYVTHDLLHIAGLAELIFDGPNIAAYAGAQRLLSIKVKQVVMRRNALPLLWGTAEASPFLEHTGNW